MDQRIADYIRKHRAKYTRDAIRQQLLDAGHAPADVDATWAALAERDPDETAGQGFWGRFTLILVGINVAVFLLVGLLTGLLGNLTQGGVILVVLAIALGITALIAWGIVAVTRPTQMGRTTALSIGIAIPLVMALLVGGACYAMIGAIGPPPRQGTLQIDVEAPANISGPITATCYVGQGGGFSISGQSEGSPSLYVSIDTFSPRTGQTTEEVANVSISMIPVSGDDPGQTYSNMNGTAELESEVTGEGIAGSVTFTDLPSDVGGPEGPEGPATDPISGTITWSCE